MYLQELTRRAEAGSCVAATLLGCRYLYGDESLEVDFERALFWLSRAAEKGASRAIANLGVMYARGLGVARDTKRAVELLSRAGPHEFHAAVELARIYSRGIDLPVDSGRALEWYSVAAGFESNDFNHDVLGAELREAKEYIALAGNSD